MSKKLRHALEAFWYGTGLAQFLMYGVWTVVASGMFALDGGWQLLATAWKVVGALIFAATIWGTMQQKQTLILLGTMLSIMVGAVYTSKAVVFSDVDVLRGATQSHYMVIVVLVAWGFYLANLCSRQRMEFKRMGISDE